MSAIIVLLNARRAGIVIDAVGGRLRCRARSGVLTPEMQRRLRAHRDELLALVADPDALRYAAAQEIFDAEPVAAPDVVRCYACGFTRNAERHACPICHPTQAIPRTCLARAVCATLGPCPHHAEGEPCSTASNAADPPDRRAAREEPA